MEFVVCKVHDIPRPLAMGSQCRTALARLGPRMLMGRFVLSRGRWPRSYGERFSQGSDLGQERASVPVSQARPKGGPSPVSPGLEHGQSRRRRPVEAPGSTDASFDKGPTNGRDAHRWKLDWTNSGTGTGSGGRCRLGDWHGNRFRDGGRRCCANPHAGSNADDVKRIRHHAAVNGHRHDIIRG